MATVPIGTDSVDWGSIIRQMLTTAEGIAGESWASVGDQAHLEFEKLAMATDEIKDKLRSGACSAPQARTMLDARAAAARADLTEGDLTDMVTAAAIVGAALSILHGVLDAQAGTVRFG